MASDFMGRLSLLVRWPHTHIHAHTHMCTYTHVCTGKAESGSFPRWGGRGTAPPLASWVAGPAVVW